MHARTRLLAFAFAFILGLGACRKNNPIGGECSGALDCAPGAERCLKGKNSKTGVCTKPCSNDAECGALATCQKVPLSTTGGIHGGNVHESVEQLCMPPQK